MECMNMDGDQCSFQEENDQDRSALDAYRPRDIDGACR